MRRDHQRAEQVRERVHLNLELATLNDERDLIAIGQRSADDRLATPDGLELETVVILHDCPPAWQGGQHDKPDSPSDGQDQHDEQHDQQHRDDAHRWPLAAIPRPTARPATAIAICSR